jgi:hypothetical protein
MPTLDDVASHLVTLSRRELRRVLKPRDLSCCGIVLVQPTTAVPQRVFPHYGLPGAGRFAAVSSMTNTHLPRHSRSDSCRALKTKQPKDRQSIERKTFCSKAVPFEAANGGKRKPHTTKKSIP